MKPLTTEEINCCAKCFYNFGKEENPPICRKEYAGPCKKLELLALEKTWKENKLLRKNKKYKYQHKKLRKGILIKHPLKPWKDPESLFCDTEFLEDICDKDLEKLEKKT